MCYFLGYLRSRPSTCREAWYWTKIQRRVDGIMDCAARKGRDFYGPEERSLRLCCLLRKSAGVRRLPGHTLCVVLKQLEVRCSSDVRWRTDVPSRIPTCHSAP
ncbi:unnamed protein product [Durusdinium trenchii]|uniref:Uncharacterized protein n=1 Tax=Durusdinium trenchii TaxID=1381693 RepID=A0ABP0PF12_9DINO